MNLSVHTPALIHAKMGGGVPLVVDEPAWLVPHDATDIAAASLASPTVLAGVIPLPRRSGELLCLIPPAVTVLVNGCPAPHAVVIRERDELILGCAGVLHRFHVTIRHAAAIQPAPAGRNCALCSVAIEAGSPAYTCVCGAMLHAGEGDCVHTTPDCPRCPQPIRLATEGGFTYWPEDLP